jgi:hypothetical protein
MKLARPREGAPISRGLVKPWGLIYDKLPNRYAIFTGGNRESISFGWESKCGAFGRQPCQSQVRERFRVQACFGTWGCRIWGLRFRVWGLGFELQGLWIGVWGLGFGVVGFGFVATGL